MNLRNLCHFDRSYRSYRPVSLHRFELPLESCFSYSPQEYRCWWLDLGFLWRIVLEALCSWRLGLEVFRSWIDLEALHSWWIHLEALRSWWIDLEALRSWRFDLESFYCGWIEWLCCSKLGSKSFCCWLFLQLWLVYHLILIDRILILPLPKFDSF